ncbi:MAG: GNAT family N-acetyltransferase [Pyrinomonadaceae bacterium]|nr:GNAT family N-acetyltransferase [Phycisphaerales bacterium]
MSHISPKVVVLSKGETVRVRCAGDADVAVLLEHRVHMADNNPHGVTEPDEVSHDPVKMNEMIKDHAEKHGWLFLVVEQVAAGQSPDAADPPGLILGELTFRNGSRRKVAHQGDFGISVHADWRGRGIGRVMIETLMEWAAAHDTIEKIFLGALSTNKRAIRLYRRLGFRKEAVRHSFFKLGPGQYVDDVMMSRWVKPKNPGEC